MCVKERQRVFENVWVRENIERIVMCVCARKCKYNVCVEKKDKGECEYMCVGV